MSLRIHCDNPQCSNTTDEGESIVGPGWVKVEIVAAAMLGDPPVRHYCRELCEYEHLYIRTHPDAGK